MKDSWERVNNKDDLRDTYRLEVFGGWLVTTSIKYYESGGYSNHQYTIAQSFVPDPNHEWSIK